MKVSACNQPTQVLTTVERREDAAKVRQSRKRSGNFKYLDFHLFENVDIHSDECEVLGEGE